LNYAEAADEDGLIIALDQEKAYDINENLGVFLLISLLPIFYKQAT
jgi:hypothetical protein